MSLVLKPDLSLLIEGIVGVVDWASHKGGGKREFRGRDLVYFVLGELTSTHPGEYAVVLFVRHDFSFRASPNIVGEINLSKQKNMLRKPTEQIFIVQGSRFKEVGRISQIGTEKCLASALFQLDQH
jgi:hypothetical protein